MIDFVNYQPPTGAEWARIQKKAGFESNKQCADFLEVSPDEVKKIRSDKKPAKKALFFMLCVYADVPVILFDQPE